MQDEEIDELIHTMRAAGVPQARIRWALEVLGQAEALGVELASDLSIAERERVRDAVAAALTRIFREDAAVNAT